MQTTNSMIPQLQRLGARGSPLSFFENRRAPCPNPPLRRHPPCDAPLAAPTCAAKNPMSSRRVSGRHGVVVDGVRYYSSDFDQLPGTVLEIRVAPDDVTRLFARVDHAWVECHADFPSSLRGFPRRLLRTFFLSRSSSDPKGGRHHD